METRDVFVYFYFLIFLGKKKNFFPGRNRSEFNPQRNIPPHPVIQLPLPLHTHIYSGSGENPLMVINREIIVLPTKLENYESNGPNFPLKTEIFHSFRPIITQKWLSVHSLARHWTLNCVTSAAPERAGHVTRPPARRPQPMNNGDSLLT